jgi:hypothetical protein
MTEHSGDPDATQEFDPIKDDGKDGDPPFRCQPRWEGCVVMVEPTPMRELRRPPDQS